MATPTIPTSEPREFVAGESLKWRKSLSDYPASDGWTLNYKFRGAGAGFDAEGVADGDDYLVAVPAAATDACDAGAYYWQAFVEKDDERIFVGRGDVTVKASLANVESDQPFDGRSQTKQTLDAIDALLAGKATLDQQSYVIGNRQLSRIPIPDLIVLRDKYAQLYNREREAERIKNGGARFKNVLVRFK